MDCLTALNNTLALRYRGDHALSAEMLQCSAFWRVNDVGNYGACARLAAQARFCVVELLQAGALVTGTQGLCLPSECTANDLQPVTTTLDRLLPGALSTQGKGVLPGAKFSTTLTCGDHATPLSAAGVAVVAVAGASLLLVIAAGLVQCGANPHPNPHPDLNPNPSTNPSPNPDPDPDQVRCMGHNGADPKPNPHPNLEPNPNPNPKPNPDPNPNPNPGAVHRARARGRGAGAGRGGRGGRGGGGGGRGGHGCERGAGGHHRGARVRELGSGS